MFNDFLDLIFFIIQIIQMRFLAAVLFHQREILIQIWSPPKKKFLGAFTTSEPTCLYRRRPTETGLGCGEQVLLPRNVLDETTFKSVELAIM